MKNTKSKNKQQNIDAKAHKKDLKEVQKELIKLDEDTNVIIDQVKNDNIVNKKVAEDIQKNIDTAVADIQAHDAKDESIQETKDRLKNVLDKLGNR